VVFSEPVINPRFHFANLDAGSVDFGGVTIARLSGNPEFEVMGALVNATTATPIGGGCEDVMGGNPNGACGTVELDGTFTSVTVTITDEDTVIGAGDGFVWTVSVDPSLTVTPIPTASEWGLFLLALLLAGVALFRLRV
jgi:hypothetical protein